MLHTKTSLKQTWTEFGKTYLAQAARRHKRADRPPTQPHPTRLDGMKAVAVRQTLAMLLVYDTLILRHIYGLLRLASSDSMQSSWVCYQGLIPPEPPPLSPLKALSASRCDDGLGAIFTQRPIGRLRTLWRDLMLLLASEAEIMPKQDTNNVHLTCWPVIEPCVTAFSDLSLHANLVTIIIGSQGSRVFITSHHNVALDYRESHRYMLDVLQFRVRLIYLFLPISDCQLWHPLTNM
jgi:hypothetical protein